MNDNDVKICESGLALTVKGMRYEISNGEEVVLSGEISCEAIDEETVSEWCEKMLYEFVVEHRVNRGWLEGKDTVKRVAWSDKRKDYIQLQAVKNMDSGFYTVQEFNSNEVFLREKVIDLSYPYEVEEYLENQYKIASGLMADVYRSSTGDCTANGISANVARLCILSDKCPVSAPSDINQCVRVTENKTHWNGEAYIKANPVMYPKRWYMAGGNFLYVSDSRFEEITGTARPIPIHDRYEG
ncbi:hypothetical protein [Enterocloster bolteae]|uniref:hypothetical protein n=1 Tax=Enterocloster bolteae TaxID=208479 RepID=UPI002A83879E|nr:hypothetical protein [Enterocloster bolteae]